MGADEGIQLREGRGQKMDLDISEGGTVGISYEEK